MIITADMLALALVPVSPAGRLVWSVPVCERIGWPGRRARVFSREWGMRRHSYVSVPDTCQLGYWLAGIEFIVPLD